MDTDPEDHFEFIFNIRDFNFDDQQNEKYYGMLMRKSSFFARSEPNLATTKNPKHLDRLHRFIYGCAASGETQQSFPSHSVSSLGPSMSLDSRNSEKDSGISDQLEEEENEIFENKVGLSHDMRFLAGMPELCDVMFLVGEERTPLFGVKAVLAIRSRVFYKMLFGPKSIPGNKNKYILTGGGTMARSTEGTVAKKLQKMFSDASSSKNSHVIKQQASGSSQRTVVVIDEFEDDVFKQLLEYVHTGSVILHPRTLLGLINAADHFALDDLRKACACFSHRCIRVDTVCSLLVTAEKYIQYKSTKIFLQRVLEFLDVHGEQVLRLSEFVHLPRHVVELVLSREELSASDITRFRATERWIRHYRLYHPQESLNHLMKPFLQYISFHNIPTSILMREIRPLAVVPDHMLMNALAVQADPNEPTTEGLRTTTSSDWTASENSGNHGRLIERSMTILTHHGEAHERSLSDESAVQPPSLRNKRCKSVDRHHSMASGSTDGGYHEDDEDENETKDAVTKQHQTFLGDKYQMSKLHNLKVYHGEKRHSTTIVVGEDESDELNNNCSDEINVENGTSPNENSITSDNSKPQHVKFMENTTIRVEYKL